MTATARAPRPQPGTPREYRFPRFERRQLDNGLTLVVAPVTKLPLVTIVALFDAGAVCDPADKPGLAKLTNRLLLEGTARESVAELTERFEQLGATVEALADWDSAAIVMTVLAQNLAPALALMGEVIREPAFPDREVARLKDERLAELLQLRAEPRGLADEMFGRFVYSASSRYARPDGGDETSINGIGGEDIRRFFQTFYVPANTTLIIAGDIAAKDSHALAQQTFGKWAGAAPRRPALDTSGRPGPAVHVIAKPDAPQSELRFGHVGPPRLTPDYYPTVVMNAILGGLFNSRVNMNLREAHAYTYGAHSAFDWRRQAGPFEVSTAVKSEVTAAAIREVLHELDAMRTAEVKRDELSLALSYLDGVFPIRFETTLAVANALTNLCVYELPEDYYDTYRARMGGVTAPAVLESARTHVRPGEMQLVIVGDPALASQLSDVGFGAVHVYDSRGQPTS